MNRLFVTTAAAGFALVLLALGNQRAAAHNVCSALPTPDGFVALRDKPSTEGRLLVRMVEDDMVVIEKRGYEFVRSGQWFKASHYRGKVFPEVTDPEYRKVTKGWVHSRLVGECG